MASCLTNRQVARWVTRRARRSAAAVRSGRLRPLQGAPYSLSKEGKGTAGPLVTALTVATVEAYVEYDLASDPDELTGIGAEAEPREVA
ncbi:hypothetical protein SA2016_3834 [Sinomonas atrocyanea]|uniref:Uncharacterized protein n=1 Tax=Sinomonas atrocyanea TaxID=37927 RepID=A0A127A6D0_9MICC|nr:hypothetical protein SA2016_3834 [Sinomonas atrocyanea]GEB65536.1 hypothetical protein SAT01_29840 [Sinomonas atrocyanea]GGG71279.1 hypothetical protein GCM10007172_24470 [Sinomonas atrocyanea]